MYEVISMEFCLEDSRLIIKTKNCTGTGTQHTNITFYQVLAYSFDDIKKENIIEEIADNSLLHFLEWYYSDRNPQKQSMLAYGLPLVFSDKTWAIKALEEEYVYYEINAYTGMDGFIIAKKMEMWSHGEEVF